jgi:hypothetical protein
MATKQAVKEPSEGELQAETVFESMEQWAEMDSFLTIVDAHPDFDYVLVSDKIPGVPQNFRDVNWYLQNHWRPVKLVKEEGKSTMLRYHPNHPNYPNDPKLTDVIVHPSQTLMHRPRQFSEMEEAKERNRNNSKQHSERKDGAVKMSQLADGVMIRQDKRNYTLKDLVEELPSAAEVKKNSAKDAEAIEFIKDTQPGLVEEITTTVSNRIKGEPGEKDKDGAGGLLD